MMMPALQTEVTRNRSLPGVWFGLLAVLLLTLAAGQASAQLDTGSIAGTVVDSSGALVPGAEIVAVSPATGTRYSTVSSSTGYYIFPSVRTGTYTL